MLKLLEVIRTAKSCSKPESCWKVAEHNRDRPNFIVLDRHKSWGFPRFISSVVPICSLNSQLSCSPVMDIILTRADHWCILTVKTVMNTPWKVPTNPNGTFISLTLNIVQPNPSTSLTEPGPVWSTDSGRIPKLTTDNSRIIYIPVIVTNSSPAASVIDLNSALSRPPSSNQSQSWCIKELRFIYWI